MTVERWILDRENDNFIIADSDGRKLYDARTTNKEPALYIMRSLIVDVYTWHGVTVLAI